MNERNKFRLKFFNDFCAESALWEIGEGPIAYEKLNISTELISELRIWSDFWVEHRKIDGWDSLENESWYVSRGKELLNSLRDELPTDWIIYPLDWNE
ncbi:MAG: hypothetical protein ACTHXA_10920 [Gulosibacter sp.]|uniref:hypothetical protein n=1 Tax=Gulosibacter sp. TaxID=2817531 RepID=UPI003F8EFD0A